MSGRRPRLNLNVEGRRAEIGEYTLPAPWPPCAADLPPMLDEMEVELIFEVVGDQRVQLVVRIFVSPHPTEPPGEPLDVGIDREVGLSQGEE